MQAKEKTSFRSFCFFRGLRNRRRGKTRKTGGGCPFLPLRSPAGASAVLPVRPVPPCPAGRGRCRKGRRRIQRESGWTQGRRMAKDGDPDTGRERPIRRHSCPDGEKDIVAPVGEGRQTVFPARGTGRFERSVREAGALPDTDRVCGLDRFRRLPGRGRREIRRGDTAFPLVFPVTARAPCRFGLGRLRRMFTPRTQETGHAMSACWQMAVFLSVAPVKVQYQVIDDSCATKNISIHAPARGATKELQTLSVLGPVFQFTQPRGMRQALFQRQGGKSLFQSAHP